MEVSIFLLARSQRAPHFIFTFPTFHHTRGNAKCAPPTETKNSWATPRGDKKRYKQCDSLFHAKNLILLTPRQKELSILCVFQRRRLRGLLLQIFEISTLFAAKSLCGKKSLGAYERKHCHHRSKLVQSIHLLRAGCQRLQRSQI